MRLDNLVEGALHVEHHGVQAAALSIVAVLMTAGVIQRPDPRHEAGGVVQRGQAHRLG
jgi:hypothetical protein